MKRLGSIIGLTVMGVVGGLLPVRGGEAERPILSEARNVQTAVYSDDFSETVAVLKADRVFTESRRVGFFRVKVLPIMVAEGVRVELKQTVPNTNWQATFRAKLTPFARDTSGLEWREVSVLFAEEKQPRLQAERVRLGAEFCALEQVTLQTETGPLKVTRAKLWLRGPPGRVVWEINGKTAQWDLFKGSMVAEAGPQNQVTKRNP